MHFSHVSIAIATIWTAHTWKQLFRQILDNSCTNMHTQCVRERDGERDGEPVLVRFRIENLICIVYFICECDVISTKTKNIIHVAYVLFTAKASNGFPYILATCSLLMALLFLFNWYIVFLIHWNSNVPFGVLFYWLWRHWNNEHTTSEHEIQITLGLYESKRTKEKMHR